MCGKFRARKSWTHVTDPGELANRIEKEGDDPLTYRVMNNLPVIVWDRAAGKRRVAPMRWGFPDAKDWRRPQPIHARSETIEITRAFADAFLDGQRGIVLMENFNEAPDIEGPTLQHTISPSDGKALAAAFVWRSFDVGAALPLFACCLVTAPANALIATLPADRMPAFLDDRDWDRWLGAKPASVDELKSCLRTVEGVKWTMTKEERAAPKNSRRKPAVSDPGGLF
jgi:putative SOS response-associated peptidase YedK